MYQSYPSGGQPPEQARPQPPGAVRTATLFMYAGAVFSLVGGILTLLTLGSYRAALRTAYPRLSLAQVHSLASAGVVVSIVLAVVEIVLWVSLAWACRGGRNWARITGSVLFGLDTVLLVLALLTGANGGFLTRASTGTVLTVLVWLAGLGAVIFLWRRESSSYFTPPAGS
jgi:hypothetical protein